MSQELNIQKILGKIDKLPTLPYVVTTLSDMVRNPNTSAADIHKVIMKDQSLSSRILKLVNSAFYGFSERISSISHAIVILGFNTVKNVALTASVFDMFAKDSKREELYSRKNFWLHSLGVATAARIIGVKAKLPSVEDLFVAGLLHDIGKLVLDQFVHERFVDVLTLVNEKDILIKDAEMEVLGGVTHAQIGAWLATKWKLPQGLVQMIGFHHRPELSEHLLKPIACIHLADIVVRSLDIGSGGDKRIPKISPPAWEALSFTEKDLLTIFSALEDEMADADQFLSEV